jgi:hypothetical protein
MEPIAYPASYGIDIASLPFFVLRESRDVIKMGAFRMWDRGPKEKCPVLDTFHRRAGVASS